LVDLHTHSLFSDGVLLPAELRRRAEAKGYRAFAITDHVDPSNCDFVVSHIVEFCKGADPDGSVKVVPGAEITHCRPGEISDLVRRARRLGALVVIVHGETLVEPVQPGTNRAGIEAGADVLAHPGLISFEDARLAAERGVMLEVSTRRGHCLTNGHVVTQAAKAGGSVVLGTDAHAPEDLVTIGFARRVLAGAGMSAEAVDKAIHDAELLLELCEQEARVT